MNRLAPCLDGIRRDGKMDMEPFIRIKIRERRNQVHFCAYTKGPHQEEQEEEELLYFNFMLTYQLRQSQLCSCDTSHFVFAIQNKSTKSKVLPAIKMTKKQNDLQTTPN